MRKTLIILTAIAAIGGAGFGQARAASLAPHADPLVRTVQYYGDPVQYHGDYRGGGWGGWGGGEDGGWRHEREWRHRDWERRREPERWRHEDRRW